MAKITPGPWRTVEAGAHDDRGYQVIGVSNGVPRVVCFCQGPLRAKNTRKHDETCEANAKAIAAVPVMIEALKAALPIVTEEIMCDEDIRVRNLIRDALKSAGEEVK